VSEAAQRRPKTWALWAVRAALAFTVSLVCIGSISSIWLGQRTETFWWLIMALPQVSIALLAILTCWDGTSRPDGLGLNAGLLNVFGLVFALLFLKWLPAVIGALTILAMVVRPREWVYSDPPPPRFGWLRR
jgi:hypothetical protein